MASGSSRIYRTKLLANEQGDVGFYYVDEKNRPLPAALNEPYKFVLLDQLAREREAAKIASKARRDIEFLRIDATTEARLVEVFSERWRLLHKHFKTDGSKEGWRKLAVALATDYIPGLKIEFVRPSPRDIKKQQRAIGLTLVVAEAFRRLRKSDDAVKPTELLAMRAVYRKWPDWLGKKPKSLEALSTEYYMRAKQIFDSQNLGYTLADLGLPTTKTRSRKK